MLSSKVKVSGLSKRQKCAAPNFYSVTKAGARYHNGMVWYSHAIITI
jgi:hypothetical protein